MEQKNGTGSSEHLNLQPDVSSSIEDDDLLDLYNMVGYSSSFSFSFSYRLGVDRDEKDTTFSKFEELSSSSPRLYFESPLDMSSTTPKLSLAGSATPTGGSSLPPEVSPQTSDLSTFNASPKQSPAIQVMGRPAGYDPNRIPLSVFAPKQTNNSEWSLASNESLFSIQMGNNSFSLDGAVFISKSGEVIRLDDRLNHSSFRSDVNKSSDLTSMLLGLPTVVEPAAEYKRSAGTIWDPGVQEELLETQNTLPASASSPSSTVPDGKGASPPEGPRKSASTPRHSDASGQIICSAAFLALAGAASPMKVDPENPRPAPPTPPLPEGAAMAEPATKDPFTTPRAGGNQWFYCFSCCPICC